MLVEQPGSRQAATADRLWLRGATVGGIAVLLTLLGLYALLHNPYWVRGGDSEVYLGIARRLAGGQGMRFNGQPVAMVPPGWPLLLAAAMKLSSSFAWLKLIPMLSMVGGLTMYYLALLRVMPGQRAAIVILSTALLGSVAPLTYWFHGEGFFLLLSAAALLLACQINQGKAGWPRIALCAALCGASLTARWTGILFWPLIAAALLRGRSLRPRLDRAWIAVGLTLAATLLTFVGLRRMLRVEQHQIDPRFDASLSVPYDIVNEATDRKGYIDRLRDADLWVAALFWSPLMPYAQVRPYASAAAWAIIGLCLLTVIEGIRRREWIWLAMAAYCAALMVNWPSAVARYFVPVAPLLLAATMQGFTSAAGWLGKSEWSQNLGLGLRAGFAGLVLLPNFASYAMDVWAMRAPDFYARWQGGTDRSLVAAAQWLRDHDLKDGELVVTRRYSTVYSDRYTNGWMRAAHVLTDRAVMTMPDSLSRDPDSAVIQWMKQNNARYYLYLPRVYVFGHFRRLSWNGVPLYPQDTDWRLYERTGEQIRQISFESIEPAVRNVPGL